MQRLCVGRVVGSSALHNRAGMLILLHEYHSYDILDHSHDTEGCRVRIQLQSVSDKISIFNLYGSNHDPRPIFCTLSSQFQDESSSHKIVGGDFNTVLHFAEDSRNYIGQHPTPRLRDSSLPDFLPMTGLIDIKRACNPEDRKFTSFSHAQCSWFRIDYLLFSRSS